MVFLFRLLLPKENEFFADIAIPSECTFLDFHQSIQEMFKYDSCHLASFVITDNDWNRIKEIPLVNFDDDSDKSPMEKYLISDFFKETGQRMLYVFDFFSERAFFVQLFAQQDNEKSVISKAVLLKKEGTIPEQVQIDLEFPETDTLYEDDDDNFDEFNDMGYDEDNF